MAENRFHQHSVVRELTALNPESFLVKVAWSHLDHAQREGKHGTLSKEGHSVNTSINVQHRMMSRCKISEKVQAYLGGQHTASCSAVLPASPMLAGHPSHGRRPPSSEAMPRERGEHKGAVSGGCPVTVSHAVCFIRKQVPLC